VEHRRIDDGVLVRSYAFACLRQIAAKFDLVGERSGDKMPVIFRDGSLRYFFFSNEGSPREPPHIHVKGSGRDAKIWLEPEVAIAESYGFNSSELARILHGVAVRRALILKAWHDYFGDGSAF
jgi:hypothetical protein